MRAIQIRCPNCAATLDVMATAMTITCSYCQTQSRVRPRTRFFETPVKMPQAPPQMAKLPIAVQKHTGRWVAGLSVGMFVFIGLMTVIPIFIVHKARQAATGHDGTRGRMLNWRSSTPLVADVNGDGIGDLLGRMQGLDGATSVHLVAYDGASGKKLWQSKKLGVVQNTNQGTVAMLGEQLLWVNDRGLARGYDAKTGAEKWKVNILEKLELACKSSDKTFLQTKDERWILLDTDTGKAAETPEPESCAPLMTDKWREYLPNLTEIDRWDRVTPRPSGVLEGVSMSKHGIVEGNDRLVSGTKNPGTAVPMIARYRMVGFDPPDKVELPEITDDMSSKEKRKIRRQQRAYERAVSKAARNIKYEVVWAAQVPQSDPLGANSSAPEHFGLAPELDCVVVAYEMRNKPIRVACLSYETGKHKWDVSMPKAFIDSLDGLAIIGKRAYLSMSSRIHALDLTNGARVFSVGQTN